MVSSISSSTLTVPSSTTGADVVVTNSIKGADKALNLLLNNSQLLAALADHSSKYVPPSKTAIMSVLWALMDDGSNFLSRDGVQRAVFAEGGGTAVIDSLWEQMNPDDKLSISAADFATNPYLNKAISSNIQYIREAIDQARIDAASEGNTSGILDYLVGEADNVLSHFSGGTGTVLDLFS